MPALRIGARWLVPVVAPPVEGGALLVGADGRVVAAGRSADVPAPRGVPSLDFGDAVLLPGLVNAHSHLELTALRGLVRGLPFPRWVRAVRRLKDALGPDDFAASARWGVLEGYAAGITATGDTGSTGAAAAALASLGARGVAYQEVFGPDPAQAGEAVRGLEAAVVALAGLESERLRVGISPHAPYTVSEPLLRATIALARRDGRPLAMHLAESPEEDHFVRHGDGPFADGLRARGIAPPQGRGRSPVAWAARAGFLGADALAIHCVTADGDDAVALARAGASVAHCPWSNAVLRNGRADLPLLRRLGVRVGLGTDSVAAGGGLDLFREMRLAALGCPLTPREMLRLATADAAAALGLAAGGLEAGRWGDVCVVGAGAAPLAAAADPEEAVAFAASPRDVVFTAVAGRPVYRDGAWPDVDAAAERAGLERAAARARAAATT